MSLHAIGDGLLVRTFTLATVLAAVQACGGTGDSSTLRLTIESPQDGDELDLGPEGTGTGTFIVSGVAEGAIEIQIELEGETQQAELDETSTPNRWQAEVGANRSGEATYTVIAIGQDGEEVSEPITLSIEVARPNATLYSSDYAPVAEFLLANFESYEEENRELRLETADLPPELREGSVVVVPMAEDPFPATLGRVTDIELRDQASVIRLEPAGLDEVFNQLRSRALVQLPISQVRDSDSVSDGTAAFVVGEEPCVGHGGEITGDQGVRQSTPCFDADSAEDGDVWECREVWAQRCLPFAVDVGDELVSDDGTAAGRWNLSGEGSFTVGTSITIAGSDPVPGGRGHGGRRQARFSRGSAAASLLLADGIVLDVLEQ